MKAVIMAGGEGTRLRPLTCGIPKPMVPVLNKPVMEHIINLLKRHEIRDIAVTMAYLPGVISDYFGDGSDFGVSIKYYTEEVPLGTGGSVLNAEDFLDDTFIIISGDAFTEIDLTKAIEFHKEKGAKATLVLKKVPIPLEYGVIITDDKGEIIRFLEKPSWGEVFSDTINTGIYVLEPEVLRYYKKGDNFDFSKDLFPKLLRDKRPMFGFIASEYWNDIGDLKVYREVNFEMMENPVNLDEDYKEISKGIWLGSNTIIEDDCTLKPPVYIGRDCTIKRGAYLESAILSDGCEIYENASIKKSILWKNVRVGKNSQCRGTVLCSGTVLKQGVHLLENTVIGEGTHLMAGSMVKPEIKIWPHKTINEYSVVNQSLVWGTRIVKALFGFRDISGDINTDLTPEFASRLGSSFGSMFKEDSKIIISTDTSNAASVLKESLISGILSTGMKVIDIDSVAMPINRFAVRFYRADAGLHIRLDNNPADSNKLHIEFVNKNGVNIDRNTERKIENIFLREDFKRCSAEKIRDISKVNNFTGFYLQNGANILKTLSDIRRIKPRIVIGAKSEQILYLASTYLENIGCKVELDYGCSEYIKQVENINPEKYLHYLAESVVKKGAAMGVFYSEDAESMILIDHTGQIINSDKYTALASLIILKSGNDKKLIVPHTATSVIDKMAKRFCVEVVRTKNSPAEIMKEMLEKNEREKTLSMDSNLTQYMLNFDAILGTGLILDFLNSNLARLNEVVNELPKFYMKSREVQCDWGNKGRVIREIIEENKHKDIELFEGVRINSEMGWVLILPDSERPVCNVLAEGYTEEYAKELTDIYSEKINSILMHNNSNDKER